MEVVLGAVADAANISREGKLNLTGIFDRIGATNFPAQHPHLDFAFRIRAESGDSGRKVQLQLTVMDQDGQRLFDAGARVEIGHIPAGETKHVSQVIGMNNLTFPKPGPYRFRVQLGDRTHDTVISVVRSTPQGTPST